VKNSSPAACVIKIEKIPCRSGDPAGEVSNEKWVNVTWLTERSNVFAGRESPRRLKLPERQMININR
jgi:hypothetical protein